MGRVRERGRTGKNVRAVGQSCRVGAELAHSLEDELESVLKLSLIGCVMLSTEDPERSLWRRVLTTEGLPLAGSTGVTSELERY